MSTKRRKRHSPEQIVRKLRDADALLNADKDLAAVLQSLSTEHSLPLPLEPNRLARHIVAAGWASSSGRRRTSPAGQVRWLSRN